MLKLLLERRARDPAEREDYDDKQDNNAIKFKLYFHVMLPTSEPQLQPKCKSEWCATEITVDVCQDSEGTSSVDFPPTYNPLTSPIGKYSDPTMLMSSLTKSVTKSQRPLLDNGRRVSFADTTIYAKSIASLTDMSEIIDLCSALHQRVLMHQNIGYLRDRHSDRMHTIFLSANAQLPSGTYKFIDLETLLDKNLRDAKGLPSVLTRRRTRLEITVTLASSLLQLHPGPWLTERWGKKDIYFFQSADGTIHTHLPFLLCKFNGHVPQSSTTPGSNIVDNENTRPSCGYNPPLLSLGILILELWFNQTIESLPFRKDFLGIGGKETEYTDYTTAQKWQVQAMDEAGLDLHNPTRRCIYCAFGAASLNLEDDELQKAVYNEVVQPLERLLQRFEEI